MQRRSQNVLGPRDVAGIADRRAALAEVAGCAAQHDGSAGGRDRDLVRRREAGVANERFSNIVLDGCVVRHGLLLSAVDAGSTWSLRAGGPIRLEPAAIPPSYRRPGRWVGNGGGVAFSAHVGGFVFGLIAAGC